MDNAFHEKLVRVETPWGWETLILRSGHQNLVPPDLSFLTNWDHQQIRRFCDDKGWQCVVIDHVNTNEALLDLRQRGVCR